MIIGTSYENLAVCIRFRVIILTYRFITRYLDRPVYTRYMFMGQKSCTYRTIGTIYNIEKKVKF